MLGIESLTFLKEHRTGSVIAAVTFGVAWHTSCLIGFADCYFVAPVTTASTDIICDDALSHYMIISLTFEAANRFFLVFCNRDLFVADYQTIEDGIVGGISAVEGDVQVPNLLARRALVRSFGPVELGYSIIWDVVHLCHFGLVVFIIRVKSERYEESHYIEGPQFDSSLES